MDKKPSIAVIEWEDHWYDPNSEADAALAKIATPKQMYSAGLFMGENENCYIIAMDSWPPFYQYRHYSYIDKRMVKCIRFVYPRSKKFPDAP